MPKGIAINIGLNNVDLAAYPGWSIPKLEGCINDARDMNAMAIGLGYTASILTDSQATCSEVSRAIGEAARALNSGDICLVTYSGHGGQMPDATGDEPDGQDETWILWDRQLLDDELNGLWSTFAAGVRIVVLSDSCHSGTVSRLVSFQRKFRSAEFAAQYQRVVNDAPRVRAGDPDAIRANYEANRAYYEVSQWTHRETVPVKASVILISGCQDNQLSSDGDANGLFTQVLKQVWNNGAFSGNYAQFHSAIVSRMPSDQTPNLYRTGVNDAQFDSQKPFTIGGTTSGGQTVLSISAPASYMNGAQPITFSVSVPSGYFFAVEVTTDANLFDSAGSGSRRNDNNFYASWKVTPFLQSSSFTMPADAWNRLRQSGSRLYYRLWSTTSSTGWVNQQVTVLDSNALAAPSVTLTGSGQATGSGVPTIIAPSSVPAGSSAPRFQVNPGANRYYAIEVSINPWYFTPQYSAQRTDDNFYGSWKVSPFGSSTLYPATFEMPETAWQRLRATTVNNRLYYRMWWTDSPTQWVNAGCTTPDGSGQNAPSFALE